MKWSNQNDDHLLWSKFSYVPAQNCEKTICVCINVCLHLDKHTRPSLRHSWGQQLVSVPRCVLLRCAARGCWQAAPALYGEGLLAGSPAGEGRREQPGLRDQRPVSDKHWISAVISPLLASALKLRNGTSSHPTFNHLPGLASLVRTSGIPLWDTSFVLCLAPSPEVSLGIQHAENHMKTGRELKYDPYQRSGSCIDCRKVQIVKDRRRRPSLFLNHSGGGSFWFSCCVVMEIFESRILISHRATADIWGHLEQPASGNLTIFNALCECWTKLMVTDLSARIHYTAH